MAQVLTYRCDICKEQKKELNHWWTGYLLLNKTEICVIPLGDGPDPGNGIYHLCGFDCVTKWLHQQMQEIINRENANRTASTDKAKV